MEQELKEHFLVEELKTVRNLCDISLLLIRGGREELLPTILELLYQEVQQIVDEHCVEGKNAT